MDVCGGIPFENRPLPEMVSAIIGSLISRTTASKHMVNVPVVDHSPMWAHLKRTHEKSEEGANEVCCQTQSSQQFHLIAQLRDDGK
jgi:hypothetical protein